MNIEWTKSAVIALALIGVIAFSAWRMKNDDFKWSLEVILGVIFGMTFALIAPQQAQDALYATLKFVFWDFWAYLAEGIVKAAGI
jgi:hypothetical protein